MRSSLRCAIFVGCALLASSLWASSVQALALRTEQIKTMQQLVTELEKSHYNQLKYDDSLAAQHLNEYIDALDPRKLYFTAKEIEQFKARSEGLDDEVKRGELVTITDLFSAYHDRRLQRLRDLVDDLPSKIAQLDFSKDESIIVDADRITWATSTEELQERWRKQFKNDVLNLKLTDKPLADIADTLQKRYAYQLKSAEQVTETDVFSVYANALTSLYDPHTSYFSPRRTENFNIEMSLSLEGIGALLQQDQDYTKVSRVIPKGPADKQGELQPSDRIVGVAQGSSGEMIDVVGWRLDEVVNLIRGEKGSTVRLEVIPADQYASGERREIVIVRNEVKLEEQAATSTIIDVERNGRALRIGVIDLPTFYIDFDALNRGDPEYRSTTRDVSRLLSELEAEAVDAVLLDLRDNGGGSLREANELTSLFIEYGPSVQIRHSSEQVWRDGKRRKSAFYDGPMGVIVNRLSASASEIFAGAIQDYGRGLIIGTQSFGKGTVQTLKPLAEGQLKITESKFYRISGDSTQHRGIEPDVTLPVMYNPEELGESTLDYALPWDQINAIRHPLYGDLSSVIPELIEASQSRQMSDPKMLLLQEQIALAGAESDIETISLNLEQRLADRDRKRALWLALENKQRALEGEEPLAQWTEDDDEDTPPEPAQDAEPINPSKDVLLAESIDVMADALTVDRRIEPAKQVGFR
ncbi:MAG: carboxy terminal-processing peptidase [Proteobacteria bacterium]|nr:carboxy terminal-processing peptidase [Pseudomonadota bacterium]